MTLLTILFIFLGWLAGIAINHAANILPKRETLRQWPSCSACGRRRSYLAWSALLAYLIGQSECAQCGQRRETLVRSLIIELVTPLFFIFMLWRYGLSLYLVLVSLYTVILLLITVTDLEHRLIFNAVTLPSILLATAAAFFTPNLPWPSALVGGAIALIITYFFALLGAFLYGHGAFGVGDVTLSTFLGLILGFPYIVLSLIFGIFLAGFVAFALFITRRVGLRVYIPYGPFLTITGWIMLIWGAPIWNYYFS